MQYYRKLLSFFSAVKLHPLSSLKIADFHLSAKTGAYLENRNPKDTLVFLCQSLSLLEDEK